MPLPAALIALLAGPALAWDPAEGEDVDPWSLVRVDLPDYPGALASSEKGSVLAAPPEEAGVPWRIEPVPDLHGGVGSWRADDAAEAIGAEAWHEAGYTGQGVKLAVFDLQWYGAPLEDDELGSFETHDCWAHSGCTPSMDTLRPRFSFETGSHGLACAEIVRDLAPDVELHLVRTNGLTTLENAAASAIREGIDVVSLSMSFMNNSFYDGTGAVSEIVEEMHAGGVLLVTSAGNYADGHYYDSFRDSDGDGVHEFEDGSTLLPIRIRAGKRRVAAVHWDNYGRCGDSDIDLTLYSEDGTVLAVGDNDQDPEADSCSPVERLSPQVDEDQWGYMELRLRRGSPAVDWNLISTNSDVWGTMPWGSVTDPGTHPLAWTVGAVEVDGYFDNAVEDFSSQGPNLVGDPKPDIVAPDGITTSVYGSGGFYGTSAAAPTAAAALALVMSRDPGLDAFEAAEKLEAWAAREGRHSWQGPDNERGAGHLRLPDPADLEGGCFGSGPWRGALFVIPWVLGLRRRRLVPDGGSS